MFIWFLLGGIIPTIITFFSALFLALIISLFFTYIIYYKKGLLSFICNFFINFFRSIPLICHFFLFIFLIPNHWLASILILGMNSSAYFSSIWLDSLNKIHIQYIYTIKTLHLCNFIAFNHILLPMIFHETKYSIENEILNLLKDTSIISFFGISEIMQRVQIIGYSNLDFFTPTLCAVIIYYLLSLIQLHIINKMIFYAILWFLYYI